MSQPSHVSTVMKWHILLPSLSLTLPVPTVVLSVIALALYVYKMVS